MRALVMKDFDQMGVESVPDPVPGRGEVLLNIVATGICGSDIHGFTGHNGRRFPGQIMGHEAVGVVAAIGEGVESPSIRVGQTATFIPLVLSEEDSHTYSGFEQRCPDRVILGVTPGNDGSFAEKMVVPASNVVMLPETMPIAHGALIEPLAVSLHACRRVDIRKDDTVLVIGGGPIGQSLVLSVLHEGVDQVYLSEPDAGRRELCRQLGAIVFDPADGPLAEQLQSRDGQLIDKVIDAVGTTQTMKSALTTTKLGGTVCLVGMGDPDIEASAYRISTDERAIVGSFCYSHDHFREAAAWVGDGDERFAALISEEVPLEEGHDAFSRLARGVSVPGKILVRMDQTIQH